MERAIDVTTTVAVPLDGVRNILRERPDAVLGPVDVPGPDRRRPHRFRTTVPAVLGSGATVEQDVLLDLGMVPGKGRRSSLSIPLDWDPTGHERLLPSFRGTLEVTPTADRRCELAVTGTYDVPLGPIGRFGDAVVGRRVARRSLAAFATRIAQRVERECIRREQAGHRSPTPYNVDLREQTGSEHAASTSFERPA